MLGRSRSVSEVWRTDRLWAPVYAYGLNHPPVARLAGALAFGTDLGQLYDALEIIGDQPDGSAILDVPCGGGVALRALGATQQVRYVACDISADMLERTAAQAQRRHLAAVELLEADIAAMPLADATFDLVVSFTGLHCVPDPEAAVRELARVTRPGGRLAASLWAADVRRLQRPLQIAARAAGLVGPSATEEQLRRWLDDAGYVDVELSRSGDFIYLTARRRSFVTDA